MAEVDVIMADKVSKTTVNIIYLTIEFSSTVYFIYILLFQFEKNRKPRTTITFVAN